MAYTHRDLAQMAKRKSIAGWHSMRKAQLVKALVKAAKASSRSKKSPARRTKATTTKAKKASPTRRATAVTRSERSKQPNANAARNTTRAKAPSPPKNPIALRRMKRAQVEREVQKDLAALPASLTGRTPETGPTKDRVVLMVRDSYWLHAYWEFTRQSVSRAQAAMAEHWYAAKPMLRLLELKSSATTNTATRVVREIEIHGGVNNWYIDVSDAPKTFCVAIGYLATDGNFFVLGQSNAVTTPRPGAVGTMDHNWADVAENSERVFALSGGYDDDSSVHSELRALFEERLRRPMGSPLDTRYGGGAARLVTKNDFHFSVDAEAVVFGKTKPEAYVTLAGEPVKLRADGTFTVRVKMPDSRQVLSIVAYSPDGVEQRTTVLSISRNTRALDPVIRDPAES
jgi:hypothetical protein